MEKNITERLMSPKRAAREAARRMIGGVSVEAAKICDNTSPYNPEKHVPHPRLIELKPERFSLEADLIDQVCNSTLVGRGDQLRLPALASRRMVENDSWIPSSFSAHESAQLKLRDDLSDIRDILKEDAYRVIQNPDNADKINKFYEIIEDVITDPNSAEDHFFSIAEFGQEEPNEFTTEDNNERIHNRLNPAGSFEFAACSYFLVRWGQELKPEHIKNADEQRRFLIEIADFFVDFSSLELSHSEKYFYSSDAWNNYLLTAHEAGIVLRKDADNRYRLALTHPIPKPAKTYGRPVGCPAGFDLTDDSKGERVNH